MKYNTKNEFEHFEFQEVHISDIQMTDDFFHIILDDVIILPENSCNRDIRKMRCNQLLFKVLDAKLVSLVEEGCKIYDADGNLKEQKEDREIAKEQYTVIKEQFVDATAYEITKSENEYVFVIDGLDEKTYALTVSGSGDTQEWDRFLNLE